MQGMPYAVHRALEGVQSSPDIWTNQEYPSRDVIVFFCAVFFAKSEWSFLHDFAVGTSTKKFF